jgi:hypothetical protein
MKMSKWLDVPALRQREAIVKFLPIISWKLSSTNYNKTIFSYATIKGYLKHGCYEG